MGVVARVSEVVLSVGVEKQSRVEAVTCGGGHETCGASVDGCWVKSRWRVPVQLHAAGRGKSTGRMALERFEL